MASTRATKTIAFSVMGMSVLFVGTTACAQKSATSARTAPAAPTTTAPAPTPSPTATTPPATTTVTPAPTEGSAAVADTAADMTAEVELSRAAIQVRRQAIVTASMDLEPKEADAFWPLYREYRLAMMSVNDRFVRLLGDFLDREGKLTDDVATKMMEEYAAIERDRMGVRTTYVPRFRAVIPPRKVARFFQVEHKLDAVVEAELALLIPLAK
jgi:hypothetical protein